MRLRIGPSLLGVFIVGGAGLALFQRSSAAVVVHELTGPAGGQVAAEPFAPPQGDAPVSGQLPPNHPAIQHGSAEHSFARDDSPAALAWHAPAAWQLVANASAMRIETYRVPAAGSAASAELTISRAGGTTEANIDRWVDQFDGAGRDTRVERAVSGFRVATVSVSGTYEGGMMTTGPETAHPAWSLLGAVVETGGPSYFFKLVGPTESVMAARPGFEALLLSLRKPG
jgi:hypothetical protein